ncbi:hypothetical protein HXX76_000857 [Chlamydomonas incerta]|uniref:SRR1-like domain-containing protein n=1 Tax=Chlamydomonas incerta TaxID=51695 RepID=A0A835WF86_CHLIN|nr:hypothetical protein HXX76_000857 [Chlamydomonas incerta]|eukprot:KAG2446268.1 hypothetical protein HXX76_000857 [Chlamydomonas incerta]
MDEDDGGWTVVRGKGKAGKRSPLKRARDECCPGDGGPCTAAPADGAAAANGTSNNGLDGGAAAPPGWPAPAGDGNRRPTKGNRRGFRERTPAEQCDALIDAVNTCRREVADSPFYASLLKVMHDASANLNHLATGSNSSSGGDGGSGAGGGQDGAMEDGHGEAGPGPGAQPGALAGGAWRALRRLVVYGLGSPHESRVSRYQLALVLLLRDQVLPGLRQEPGSGPGPGAAGAEAGAEEAGPMPSEGVAGAAAASVLQQGGAVELYDPAFDDVDMLALQKLGLQVIAVNEDGARRVSEPTLFYLPHCEGVLCDALLGANWSAGDSSSGDSGGGGGGTSGAGGGLPSVVILGNSFRTYQDRWELQAAGGSRASKGGGKPVRPGRIIRSCELGAVVELRTPDLRFPAPSAFNDMSLHLFPPSEALQRLLTTAQQPEAQPEGMQVNGVQVNGVQGMEKD